MVAYGHAYQNEEFDILHSESYFGKIGAGFFMSIENRDIRKIGIYFLLLAFVFVTIILSAEAAPALAAVTFTLILILEILFAFTLNPQQPVCTAYHFRICLRSPPNR
jgi:hypothetical protein